MMRASFKVEIKRAARQCVFLALASCAALAPAAFCAEPETVIVPYDPGKPVARQQPDQFYLPYERFLELWEKAKAARRGSQAEPAPVLFALNAARYDGHLEERALKFTGTLDLTTHNDRWVKVPLPFRGAKVSGLKLDGAPTAFDGEAVVVEKPGRHRLEVTFELPRARGETQWKWNIPRTAATLVSMTLPGPQFMATILPSNGSVERVSDGVKTVSAAVGATGEVRVEIESTTGIERVAEPAVVKIRPRVEVSAAVETTRAELVFEFPKARQDRFTLHLPNEVTLIGLEVADLKSWKLIGGAERQSLELTLNEPARDTLAVTVIAERALPALPAEWRAPAFSAAAGRVEQVVALFAGRGVEVSALPDASLRQTTWERPTRAGFRLVSAYAGSGSLPYRVAIAEPRREARVDYVYQVNRRKIELIASLQLEARGDDLFTVQASLPPQFEVQAVESERLQQWWREGDLLHLRFHGATPETTALVVYLVRLYPTAPTALEVRPLALQGFKKVTGSAVIAAHKGVEVGMELNVDGRDVAPDRAATDFQILAPLERKRGFTFQNQAFAAQVTLAGLPPKVSAVWVLHAQAHEGWASLSARARLTVRQGSIERTAFTWPAALPEARVHGADVREMRSRVEGDRRIYEVDFQSDVHDAVDLTIEVEVPQAGQLTLPALIFPEAQMTSGYVLTDNASEYEMKVVTSGVDPVPSREIPWLPDLSKSAGIFRVQPNWSVTLHVERLEKAASRAAFCAWAEMTSALRRDGTEWHRATWRLQNRSLQFLPVKLPPAAELMSARVAGQNVRADQGVVEGQAAILVPLIKTRPGDLSYDVELVYRRTGKRLGARAGRALDDPELIGITVERTFWNVWVPEDHALQRTGGNMEPVLEEVTLTEKLEGELQELKGLASIVNSEQATGEARENAKSNIDRLKKTLEQSGALMEEKSQALGERASQLADMEGGKLSKQSAEEQNRWAKNKQRLITEELSDEVQKLSRADAAKDQPPAAAAEAALRGGASPQPETAGTVTQRWQENPSYREAMPAPATPSPTDAGGRNFFLNDNVVLQQRVPPPSLAPAVLPDSAKEQTAVANKEPGAQPKLEALRQELESARPELAEAKRGEEERMSLSQSAAPAQPMAPGKTLSMARGNRAQLDEQAQQQLAQDFQTPPPTTAPMRGPAPPANSRPGPPAAPSAGFTAELPRPGDDSSRRAAFRSVAEAPRLQPAARISLAVNFPTEGHVHHFKKVKANAALDLRITRPADTARWESLSLFAALAVLLAWAGRRLQPSDSSRPSRRATT